MVIFMRILFGSLLYEKHTIYADAAVVIALYERGIIHTVCECCYKMLLGR